MKLSLTVVADDAVTETAWERELRAVFEKVADVKVGGLREGGPPGQLIFIDGTQTGGKLSEASAATLGAMDRRGKAVFMIARESAARCEALENGSVDDVMTYPFRTLDVLGRIKHYQQIMMWDEVQKLNSSFSQLIAELREDLTLAERMQKARLPIRFPDVKGFKIANRSVVGWRSGDYLDLAESRDGSQLSLVLTDSSSSRLSSAMLTVLMRVAVKLSSDEVRSSMETVKRIYDEIALALGEKDRLSLFYGVISRKDYRLRYVNFGTSSIFRAPHGASFEMLPVQGDSITRTSGFPPSGSPEAKESEVDLEPKDRLVLLSDGFIESAGGISDTLQLLNKFRDNEPADLLNELSFRVKSKLTPDDELPPQDCTVLMMDVADRLIRLAR